MTMGLDCSHDAFHGAYSAFNSFRQAVAFAIGGSYPPHYKRDDKGSYLRDEADRLIRNTDLDEDFVYTGDGYTKEKFPGLFEFLEHSDCDGCISPQMCKVVADDLEPLLDKMPEEAFGHIARDGGYRQVLQRFIDGCRAAHSENEPLYFK
jgi:hypothetical protein